MKKSLILMSVSALLFVSPGITGQPSDKKNAAILQDLSATQSTTHRFDQILNQADNLNGLMLAKVNINTEHENDGRLKGFIIRKKNEPSPSKVDDVKVETTQAEYFSDEELIHLRELFLQAEKSVKKNKKAEYLRLAGQLKEYPLYPYLQYQWLKKHLDNEEQIKHFLEQNKSSRFAGKLKRKWLYRLAKHKQWPLFLQFYTAGNETKLNCYYHQALYNTGNKQAALHGAKNLWTVGRSQPSQCDPLFTQLKKSSLFTQDLIWQRFDAALQNNKVSLATYIKGLMPKTEQTTAQLWINLHRNPSRYMQQLLSRTQSPQSALMLRHAIKRLTRKDVAKAIKIWDTNKEQFNVNQSLADKQATDKLEKKLAFKLVFKQESGAYERLSQLNAPDNSSREWRIRVALMEQNWHNVITAIQDLTNDKKQEEKWQYWLARAYIETGEVEQAEKLLSELSNNRSFYGYLAADKVNSLYQLSDNPVNVSSEEISELKNRKEFRVAFELMMLERKTQAKLQWWHALRALNKKEILVAAKLAQQWQWSDEIAIFTIAKAKYWDDIEVRFPLSYTDKIHENSAQHNLNPVIIYGLIRRESAFNEKATSPSGARGLMQIMPRTGKDIARNLKERWRGKNSLYNPVTNLKYGSYYYQKLLTQFDGHYALALAAYNAGPHRVKKWLPETEALPADIWIETIPFHETREYVISVLAYTLIYQQRTQPDELLSMNELARDVQPLSSTP